MATLIQMLQNVLAGKDPLLANETRRILLKEALHALILDYLYNHREYRGLRFYGGTCLHVIYGLNRLSEDLDLDNSPGVDLSRLRGDISNYIRANLDYRSATVKEQRSSADILRVTLRFPVLFELGLSSTRAEGLHMKIEITHHPQISVIKRTPVISFGRSFVPAHFSLETMMAGKMLACLERSFQVGRTNIAIKGRDYYDLLWFMQQRITPLEPKLQKDGEKPYTIRSAMLAIEEKVNRIRIRDLEADLLPLFEQRSFIENWIASFHENFHELARLYV